MEVQVNPGVAIPIYPKVKIFAHLGRMQVWTKVRKEKDGVWYTTIIYKRFDVMNTHQDLADALSLFHTDVYLTHILGIVDTTPRRDGQKGLYELDKDQRSEEERLNALLP